MTKILLLKSILLPLFLILGFQQAQAQAVFINEIHYDNASTDAGEAIEIAGPSGTSLEGWSLVAYNGNGGVVYASVALSGTVTDQAGSFGTLSFSVAGLQNGAPDGIALVNAAGEVIQFLSYEGSFTATDGPAAGMTSSNIGVGESGSAPAGLSLQLTGTGTTYPEFTWAPEATSTFGAINTGQSFGGDGGGTDPEPEPEPEPNPGNTTTVFINEIHYDNSGTDTGEGVELAGLAGTDLAGWQLVPYNGNGGTPYDALALSGLIPNQQGGWGTFFFPISGLQNGSPDGIALVDAAGTVLQFLSYEGTLTATSGPADGITSTDIGLAQESGSAVGSSLQLSGTGNAYEDFTWISASSSYNAINADQTLLPLEAIVFINELHYDNDGGDVGEGVEVAGTAGADLTGWSLVPYNGNGGGAYSTTMLSGLIPAQQNGYGTLFFQIIGLQNGAPDGIALVDAAGEVVQFLSYEGSFIATDGPAAGQTSTDIGVSQSSSTAVGQSLQLTGSGLTYADFSWTNAAATYNTVNSGQQFGNGDTEPDPDPEPQPYTIADTRTLPLGTEVIINGTLTVSSELGGPAYIQDSTGGIPLFDAQVHAPEAFSIGDSIQITAVIGAYQSQVQLVDVSNLQYLGTATQPIVPRQVTVAELSSVEGQLVTITDASFADTRGLLFPESNYTITDGTGTSQLRIDGDVESLVGRYLPQTAVDITGVVGSFRGAVQILPRLLADLPGTEAYEQEGTDIPVATTLEVMSWNMEFFGSTLPNFGPSDVQLQLQNAKELIDSANADIIAVQEISDESLLQELANLLGYEKICSDRFSYSFEGPDPSFPEQKICYLYNPETISVVDERVLFEAMYDAARSGASTPLDNYPGAGPSSFWSSGRLPYLLTVDATIGGITERIQLINIHAKSGSASDDLIRRRYDVEALKDTLDQYYADANIILLGDYNDDVDESIGGGPSTYSLFVADEDFEVLTASLSEAGLRSYITQDNVIDHITISNELEDNYLEGTETLIIPFSYIENYANTTSDHLPVLTRFELYEPLVLNISGDNMVYYGYEPEACTTLTASVSGGKAGYTYVWSTGATGASLEVCPDTSTEYSLTVTDAAGNTVIESFRVCVIDATCEEDKLQLCWQPNSNQAKYVQLCLPKSLAEFFIKRGASLGACFAAEACEEETAEKGTATAARTARTQPEVQVLSLNGAFALTPSLATSRAKVDFVVLEEGRTSIKVYNTAGQEMATLYNGVNAFGTVQTAEFSVEQYKAGIYLIKMTTASGAVFSTKLIVQY